MEAMLYRMRMAATAFAALVVLGVLLFAGDDEVAEETASTSPVREAPVVRAQPPERLRHSAREAMDGSSEFTSDEDLIDDAEGLSTEGFDSHGIDTEGFETEGFETEGLEPEPDMDTAPAIETAFE